MIRNIVLIGAGNLATQLGFTLQKKGLNIRQVFSRNIENANILADKLDAYATDNLQEIKNGSDLYILAIKDSALTSVIEALPKLDGILVHTAASMGIEVFNGFSSYGIFYPFQTFSKDREVDFSKIPVLVEANCEETESSLMKLGKMISDTVMSCDSEQRGKIHLAAVFACNFSNQMYSIANDILTNNNISFDVIKPLILETAKKIEELIPADAQTGPAVREDHNVIDKHLSMLSDDADLQLLYKTMTDRIIESKKHK